MIQTSYFTTKFCYIAKYFSIYHQSTNCRMDSFLGNSSVYSKWHQGVTPCFQKACNYLTRHQFDIFINLNLSDCMSGHSQFNILKSNSKSSDKILQLWFLYCVYNLRTCTYTTVYYFSLILSLKSC